MKATRRRVDPPPRSRGTRAGAAGRPVPSRRSTRAVRRGAAALAACAAVGLAPAPRSSPGEALRPPDEPAAPDVAASAPHTPLFDPHVRPSAPSRSAAGGPAAVQEVPARTHEFHFTRAVYTGGRGFRGRGAWATDFPKADRQFLFVLDRLMERLDASPDENPVRLDDPALRRFPFLYALEVGYMSLTVAEAEGLRDYLEAGGFLLVDDFWGTREWRNFEREIGRVLPGRPIVDLPPDHPVFHQFYDIDEILQVPSLRNALRGGPTHERDGHVPRVRGIFDDDGRLMVMIAWNTDLGDAWEWSENPYYPIRYSNFAWKLAVNAIVYATTH